VNGKGGGIEIWLV